MEEQIKLYMKQFVTEGVFPGACYAFFYKDKFFMGSVGRKSLFPVTETNSLKTMYDAASLTKVVVVTPLISFAVSENKIKVSDVLKDYLIDFPFANITILHLLTHCSGLSAKYDKNNLSSREEVITNIELLQEPGTIVEYRDVNYLLLGFVLEKIYGETLDVLAQKYIFKPLNMKDTTFCPSDIKRCAPTEVTEKRGIVRGIVHDEKAYALGGIAGNAGMFTTIQDMSKFVRMVLRDGKKGNQQIISTEIIDSWFNPVITNGDGIKRSIGWCIGSSRKELNKFASDNSIFHTGFVGNALLIDRDREYAMILLSNRVHPTRENERLIERRKEMNEACYRIVSKNS